MLEERFKDQEKKRDEREREYQQKVTELKAASTWGQKLHIENDAESRTAQELNKLQSAQKNAENMVTTQSEMIKEFRATNQMLKERVDLNKKRMKDLTNVLNEYDKRLKVNAVKEFVNSSRFEDVLPRVIGPWFKNDFSFYTTQVEDLLQRAGKSLTILMGLNMGRVIAFHAEPYVSYPKEFLLSYASNAKLPSPFKFLKGWSEEEEKKDRPEGSRKSERKR
ncbi:hypothetical protein Dimus_006022 [Dionaea muscipula]